jgi:hypothetical protein
MIATIAKIERPDDESQPFLNFGNLGNFGNFGNVW